MKKRLKGTGKYIIRTKHITTVTILMDRRDGVSGSFLIGSKLTL